MNTQSGTIWKAVAIGVAVIPITMTIFYLLMLAFDHWNMPTAARAAAWIAGMVWAWPIAVFDAWFIPPEDRYNRHGRFSLSILAPIPYVLIAYGVRRYRARLFRGVRDFSRINDFRS
jgi:hypothetical protein